MRYQSLLRSLMWIVPCALLATACDEDPNDPNGDGQVSASITDDPATNLQQMGTDGRTFVVHGQTATAQFTGTISGEAAVEITADGETWIELGSPRSFDLDAQVSGSESSVHTSADVPVGAYTRVRLVLEQAEAQISAGSTIGGITLTADAVLMVGGADQSVVVEVPMTALNVSADGTTAIRFDLNAESWVTESTIQASTVTDAELSAAVTAAASVEGT